MKKLTKEQKKDIIDKYPSKSLSESYTEEEWAELMFATPSEIREDHVKRSKEHGLLKFLKGDKNES